ncbi:hypothetical protein [Yersinia enterocolitica]|uniref:hypothetical protein n=1 Tax=Yersinia enterocolitica TaxID=630 RepID=UPI0038CD2280
MMTTPTTLISDPRRQALCFWGGCAPDCRDAEPENANRAELETAGCLGGCFPGIARGEQFGSAVDSTDHEEQ